ncbi:hypothetical protein AF335_12555 [Streptomyces eurocidicus]|uniref:Integral membrane protein n=1 Tax=Streptomyces eurocidicus TaxID=66423 RepID=A0A2N8NY15_STREU|nr:hypothetical protein [Streptomyces eurocidicus]MBB5119767.1 hypothetical protein [Streptomyces eurocidicus]MBF6050789.1 hypothetical protein [Streptomyces eurocidicus]PNE33659.1 hypothetical protein AF335_12555 [Streptomyces eurocidicus]
MNYLRGFIPWIVFAAVSSAGWQWGAVTALVAALVLLVQDHKAGIGGDSLILERSTVVFFAALSALAFAVPHSGLREYGGPLSAGWLALTAWVTVIVGRPFTTGIAKRHAPPEAWGHPLFRRINVVISSVWAAAFTLSAAALTGIQAAGLGLGVYIPVQVAGFVLPAVFTARYPDRARARARAQAGASV